jgi:hypothetical protein
MRSFAIVTTEPNEFCAELHNRMPVILAPGTWPAWLGEEPADEAQLKSLLAPYPSDDMICWPVSARRQCEEQRSVADRADRFAVIRLSCRNPALSVDASSAVLFVILFSRYSPSSKSTSTSQFIA